LDKYCLDTSFRHDFDESSHWYVQNILNYKRDRVKGIKDQVDEAVTLGYRIEFERYDLTIDIAPGPAIRYINAENFNTKWVAMAVIAEDLNWKISKLLKLEQNLYVGMDLSDTSQYSAYFRLGFVVHATEVMDIALRYSYDYDAVNASTAEKTEQRLHLSFEFPFNWR
jgi:putative salt-induced outer membrane protein YdiY